MNLTLPFIITIIQIGFQSIADVVTSILLGNILPVGDFGRFKLFNNIIDVLGGMLVLGQGVVIIRRFGSMDADKVDWRRHINMTTLIGSGIAAFLTVALVEFYNLWPEMPYILLCIPICILVQLHADTLRGCGRFQTSIFLTRLSSISFCLFLVVGWAFGAIVANTIYALFACGYLVSFFVSRAITGRIPNGPSRIKQREMYDGLIIFCIAVSFIVLKNLDRFFIAKMLDYEALGGYSAIVTITQGYGMVAMGLWHILMPTLAKGHSLKRSFIIVVILSILITNAFYIFLGSWVLHIIFHGKFDSYAYLLPYFIVVGNLSILYIIPGSYLSAKTTQHQLRLFLVVNGALLALNFAMNFTLIPKYQLVGAITTTIICTGLRVAGCTFCLRKGDSSWI